MTPSVDDTPSETTVFDGPVPLRIGGPCPNCGAPVLELDFLSLPGVAIKREMYDVCVIDTDGLPTPWRHRTAVAHHEDVDPLASSGDDERSLPG